MYLRFESPAWPCHFGGLAIVDGRGLLDDFGQLRLGEIRDHVERRLTRMAKLRQRVNFPGPLSGGPVWVDDRQFSIEHHVHQAAVSAPGGDAELLEAAARLHARVLDRAHPLWELWFLTGLRDDRIGMLLKLHHAMADGMAAVGILGSLFDAAPDAGEASPVEWAPRPMPGEWSLFSDNLSGWVRTMARGAAMLWHPRRVMRELRVFAMVVERSLGKQGAARTSLNRVVRAGRRIRFFQADLAKMRRLAHARGGTVNDVVLNLWAGGLRQLLVSRGERTEGVELTAGQAVSLRSRSQAGTINNQTGTVVLPLPVFEANTYRRLDRIIRTTRHSKAGRQLPAAIHGVLTALAASPVGSYVTEHQRATNVIVTHVPGPRAPVYAFGARILNILPMTQLLGNIGLTLAAFSYAGQISLVVTADASAFPDLDVLMAGMEEDWRALTARQVAEAVPA